MQGREAFPGTNELLSPKPNDPQPHTLPSQEFDNGHEDLEREMHRVHQQKLHNHEVVRHLKDYSFLSYLPFHAAGHTQDVPKMGKRQKRLKVAPEVGRHAFNFWHIGAWCRKC